MVVDWPPVVRSLVAVLPPMAAMTLALGPYDGYFEDRQIFILFLAGLGVGLVVAFLEVSLLVAGGGLSLVYVLGAPFAAQLAKAVVLNLPRFQADAGTVFLGASLGAGTGSMIVLGYGNTAMFLDPANLASTGGSLALLATGVAALHVVTGAYVGHGVAEGAPFQAVGVAGLATVPQAFGVSAYVAFRSAAVDRYTWGLLVLAYGLVAFAWARREVFERGLTDDQRRQRRREIRKAS